MSRKSRNLKVRWPRVRKPLFWIKGRYSKELETKGRIGRIKATLLYIRNTKRPPSLCSYKGKSPGYFSESAWWWLEGKSCCQNWRHLLIRIPNSYTVGLHDRVSSRTSQVFQLISLLLDLSFGLNIMVSGKSFQAQQYYSSLDSDLIRAYNRVIYWPD